MVRRIRRLLEIKDSQEHLLCPARPMKSYPSPTCLGFNRGISFGLLPADEAWGVLVLIGVTAVISVGMAGQPEWAMHGSADLEKAWAFAGAAGLDVPRAKAEAASPNIDRVLEQDIADVKANNVRQTPTFFVNGKPLINFGPQELLDLVQKEVEQTRKKS